MKIKPLIVLTIVSLSNTACAATYVIRLGICGFAFGRGSDGSLAFEQCLERAQERLDQCWDDCMRTYNLCVSLCPKE
jgi:hypothetical protein